jgi:hypothetical protein
MSGLKLFGSFAKSGALDVLENKKLYLRAFLALILITNLETLGPFFGIIPESNAFIFLTIAATLGTFIVLSQIVLIQKKIHGGVGELKYFVPTFLLYNLYYSFLFLLGLVFLILPGFYVLIFFSMAPFMAVLDDECHESFFKRSKLLVKKNVSLVAWASIINLILEFSSLIISPIQNMNIKALANFCLSIPNAFVTIVMTIATVKIYYYLKRS